MDDARKYGAHHGNIVQTGCVAGESMEYYALIGNVIKAGNIYGGVHAPVNV